MTLLAALSIAAGSIAAQDKPQDKKDPAAEKKKADKNDLPLEMPKKLEFETDEGTWISLDVTPDKKAAVVLRIDDPAFRHFKQDARCQVRVQSLLGEKYVGISVGGEEETLGDGDTIRDTQSSLVLEDLIGKFLLNSVNKE